MDGHAQGGGSCCGGGSGRHGGGIGNRVSDAHSQGGDAAFGTRGRVSCGDVADVRSPGDMAEQAARIDKLRADAKRDDDKGEEIRVELTPEAEEYAG